MKTIYIEIALDEEEGEDEAGIKRDIERALNQIGHFPESIEIGE